MARIVVIGAGAWGTTLSRVLAQNGHDVGLWSHDLAKADLIQRSRVNPRLPDYPLEPRILVSHDLSILCRDVSVCICALPSDYLMQMCEVVAFLPEGVPILSVTKGLLDGEIMCFASSYLEAELGTSWPVGVLSGPNLASEILKELPSATVVAFSDPRHAELVQSVLSNDYFRVYTSSDVASVELGGMFKNIIAIAAGVVDGLGLGVNAKSAMLTRGLHEMLRLASSLGVATEPLVGLSGLGDMVATCSSESSRNWRVGNALAQGESILELNMRLNAVAEGVKSVRLVSAYATTHGLELPISMTLNDIIFNNMPVRDAVATLMARPLKSES